MSSLNGEFQHDTAFRWNSWRHLSFVEAAHILCFLVKKEKGIHTITSLLASQIICHDPNTPSAISLLVFMTWSFHF